MDPLTMSTITMTLISLLYAGGVLNGLGLWDDLFGGGSGADGAGAAEGEPGPDFADTVMGADGPDLLQATVDGTFFDAQPGDDTVTGSDGNDSVDAGTGDDQVALGPGNDSADGGAGADLLEGEAGDDQLAGGEGADTLNGGDGADTMSGGAGNDLLSGFDGTDLQAADRLDGGADDDTLILLNEDTGIGGEGSDSFVLHHDIDADSPPAVIADYTPSEDILVVQYVPQTDEGGSAVDPVLEVSQTEDGTGSNITLDGVLRGTVQGQPGLTADDVTLTALV